ncbi:hypothetical protein VTN31DRAFT_717 [Thermomyces dupontii]|uniref:uncharacterized protein n=1 Tax=Talaromyces thermophilus TaxID=28565 RepID=UPI00374463D3
MPMASLSEEERRVIKDHPLNNSLHTLQGALRDLDSSYNSENADDQFEQLGDVLSHLLHTLSSTKAALNLRSRISSRNLRQELAALYLRVRDGDLSYDHCRPLVKLVIQNADDTNIWGTVFNLIATTSRATPLAPSAHHVVINTPIKTNSGSLRGSEQTRNQVDLRVFQEIQDCTYRNVQGFYEKYFENKVWTDLRKKYTNQRDTFILAENGSVFPIRLHKTNCLHGCSSYKTIFFGMNNVVTTGSISRGSLPAVSHDGRLMSFSNERAGIPRTTSITGGTLR